MQKGSPRSRLPYVLIAGARPSHRTKLSTQVQNLQNVIHSLQSIASEANPLLSQCINGMSIVDVAEIGIKSIRHTSSKKKKGLHFIEVDILLANEISSRHFSSFSGKADIKPPAGGKSFPSTASTAS